ncbi:terminase large subunit [Aureliella helgolandensis]|uniref:Phage Terminase n=1 Tax=Aureliella helgolandensis TaxID=2527968 RepID=A0A518G733_9BACT|nr:terminase TerL endonuclease subunit [Aureliella helgolandensis]QDV24399.1 Phage Terminase [Aureliella helgolandensis]
MARSPAAKKRPKPARRKTTRLLDAIGKAKRAGWYKYLRQGEGEEADERAIIAGCYFDPYRADHWLEFADEYGTLTEGPWKGKPFRLMEWQATATGRLFGWLKESPEWGYPVRRFRYLYLEVPKKSGKTPLLSLIGNYLLFGDSWDRQINLYLAATTRKQAERCLMHAVRQVRNHPNLKSEANIRKLEGFYSIEYGDNSWSVVAADPDSADGVNGHCLADEFHRWKGFEFYNALKWMLASQPEGVFAAITTAGSDMQSACRTVHEKTKAVNSGRQVDEAHLGQIWAADKDDDPHDEKTWHKANPSLGSTKEHPLKLSTFRQDYEAAKQEPSQWPAWLRLRLNIWLTAENAWLDEACPRGIEDWDSGATARKTRRVDCFEAFNRDELAEQARDGLTAYLGLDFASVRDTNAAVVSIKRDDQTIAVIPHFWLPEREAERQAKRVPYRQWADAGHIKLTPGDVIDYNVIFDDLVAIQERWGICKFFYDPLFQAEWMTQRLETETGAVRWEFPQTIMQYGPIIREVERQIIGHDLRHDGNPVLTWQIGNAQARTNANQDKRLIKQKHGDYRKVDGPQAMIMSLSDIVAGIENEGDYYENNEVEVI